jgi:hypothetical protein
MNTPTPAAKPQAPPACRDCSFFDPVDADLGECHRYAPHHASDQTGARRAVWAHVAADDWCGDFQPISAAQRDTPMNPMDPATHTLKK